MNPDLRTIRVATLMERSGVAFGTSGARGLVSAMTDEVCYVYTRAFLQHLQAAGEIAADSRRVAVAGDLRPSSGRIMRAVARAALDGGFAPAHCGRIPSPAVALYGIEQRCPSIMVTGSHIPDDRNGIKFNRPDGEISKTDEAGIRAQTVTLPADLIDDAGAFRDQVSAWLPEARGDAHAAYVRRYLDFFPPSALTGLRVGLYEHSCVARDALAAVLSALGAEVVPLGRSEVFVPVDTEAIRPEDIALARGWAAEGHFDALVSADGDGDRPLLADERGVWLRGDVAGILCARYLGADAVVTPVSSNTAVERCGWFRKVLRTRIGSPYVIDGMARAVAEGARAVVGYEANGGFLTASELAVGGRRLTPLPTRDAVLVVVAILTLARRRTATVSRLLEDLPARHTASDRLKDFPTELSRAHLAGFDTGDAERDRREVEAVFGRHFGRVSGLDRTDGLRITFANGDVAHLRPSGNAPELRCYNEAASEAQALEMNRTCLAILDTWRETTEQGC